MLGITEQEVGLRLAVDNPWWRDKDTFLEDMRPMPRRDLFTPFHELLTNLNIRRAPILMGPRRVGKSVLIHQSIAALIESGVDPRDVLYVSLDTPVYTGLGLEQILRMNFGQEGILERRTRYVFFDEVQYLKEWERHLKSLVDALPHMRFCASGSAAAALKLKSNESGAGRFTDFYLPGLSFAEFVRFAYPQELDSFAAWKGGDDAESRATIERMNECFIDYLNFGGFPEPALSPDIRRRAETFVRNDIIDKVLLRDLPSLYGIDDIQELNRLFTMLAYQTGREVSLEGLAQESSVAKNTLRKYLTYLEAAFLIIRLPRIDATGQRFKRENFFKVHLTIPSLRAALFGPMTGDEERFGDVVETGIAAQFVQTDLKDQICYARWNKGEVDFVWTDGPSQRALVGLEVKWSDRFVRHPEELRSLISFTVAQGWDSVQVTTKTLFATTTVSNIRINHMPAASRAFSIAQMAAEPLLSLNARVIFHHLRAEQPGANDDATEHGPAAP